MQSQYFKVVLLSFLTLCGLALFGEDKDNYEWFKQHGFTLTNYSLSEDDLESLVMIIALKESYPGKIIDVIYKHNDWQLQFSNKQWLSWAGGKLLPRELLIHQKNYASYFNARYVVDIPDPKKYSPDQIRSLNQVPNRNSNYARLIQEGSYLNIQYGGITKATIEPYITTTSFLGYRFQTHQMMIKPLERIEKKILLLKNSQSRAFIASLGEASSYNWRTIKGSKKYSYHSFGVAVDLLPKLRNKALYWDWTRAYNADWVTLPLSERWMVPIEIITIFEDEGFIWGGKWMLYDNMHFEYRPELKKFYHLSLDREIKNGS